MNARRRALHQQGLQEGRRVDGTAIYVPFDYNARENARADRMRTFVRPCEHCGGPIYQDPGHCAQCAWDGPSFGDSNQRRLIDDGSVEH